jgi:hypothetical protein
MGALNIKDIDVAKKARRLAKLKGTTITAAVSEALDESLKNAERKSKLDRDARERRVDEALKRFRKIIPPDSDVWKAMDEMYDDNGLPK